MPRLLDLFCGAGGAAMGYHRAGCDYIGLVGTEAQVAKAVANAQLVAQATRPRGLMRRLLKR